MKALILIASIILFSSFSEKVTLWSIVAQDKSNLLIEVESRNFELIKECAAKAAANNGWKYESYSAEGGHFIEFHFISNNIRAKVEHSLRYHLARR